MTKQHAFIKGISLTDAILLKMTDIGAVQRKFISHLLVLILSIKGRINFLQLERFGSYSEKSFRNQFKKSFDWLKFNTNLIKAHSSDEIIIGFDPSYISKSGKHTSGIGYFYSGCSGGYERGLEISVFSAIDINQNTAYHLIASQTKAVTKKENEQTLMDQYIELFESKAKELKSISPVLVVDAYFSKREYVKAVVVNEMELISRLRSDANLRYLYNGAQRPGRGRPKKYNGKVKTNQIDKRRAKLVYEDDEMKIYGIIVNSVNLKMDINLVYVEYIDKKGKVYNVSMYFSTNLKRPTMEVLKYYKARFQMEYNFRDGKQHTGLMNCQARSKEKLEFHFNASLTAINIGKCIARHGLEKEQSTAISISNIKTELSNQILLNFIFSKFGIDPNLQKNKIHIQDILEFGKIAA